MAAASVKEKSTLQLNPTTFSDKLLSMVQSHFSSVHYVAMYTCTWLGCKKLVKSGQYIPDFGMGVKTWCEELALAANPCQRCQD